MRQMKIFAYANEHPQEILAVTDEGEEIRYSELTDLAGQLGSIVGHRLVFVLCRNTPGSLLGYLGLLQSGGVPLLLDAGIAPQLLRDLMTTYHPAYCLFPGDLPAQTGDVIREAMAGISPQGEKADEPKLFGHRDATNSPQDDKAARKIRDYCLCRTAAEGEDPALAPDLRLLLTTSGSTGSSKLVRISGDNLDANAESIVEYLQITKDERPITVLPMQYSYGMSILHTHVMVGAPILLTSHTLMERVFWERMQQERATSLCGVPYTFEIYNRLGLMEMDLPDLHYITQAGGKLPEKCHMQFACWCAEKEIRFYVMYGQTEASPRMGWLPPEKAIEKCGSMGIAIPGGTIDLIDENGNIIPPENTTDTSGRHNRLQESVQTKTGAAAKDAESVQPERGVSAKDTESVQTKTGASAKETETGQIKTDSGKTADTSAGPVGELVYTGPNVALGYARCAADLSKGDEFGGVLHTGDMARRDADGYLYIVGRRSRFIKMVGKRIGLDEVEKILRAAFPELDLACAGKDDELHVYVVPADTKPAEESPEGQTDMPGAAEISLAGQTEEPATLAEWMERICACIQEMTGIPERRVRVCPVPEIPRNSSGKIWYAELQ